MADNIVNISRQSGFYTEWISAQGNSGKSNNYIVAIASTSEKHQWIHTQYDSDLLPALDEALKVPGKKSFFYILTVAMKWPATDIHSPPQFSIPVINTRIATITPSDSPTLYRRSR